MKHQQKGAICSFCSNCSLPENHNCHQVTVTLCLPLQRTPNFYLERERARVKTPKKSEKERQTGGKERKGKKLMMMNNLMKFLPLGEVEAKLL